MPDGRNKSQKSTAAAPKTGIPPANTGPEQSASQEKILKKRGYTLGKMIGEGSYAKVYLAEFVESSSGRRQKLACKLINGSNAPKDFLRKFFPREVEIMSKVNHQYLIRVHSILQRKQRYFIFMQYAENGDLLDFIRTNGPLKEKQARVWFAQLIKGLKYLHEREIAHRDMKCENVLLTGTYNIKISDFGFARYTVDEQGKPIKSVTFCGSVSYASPEIIRGVEYDCKLSDIWAIGIILYIMLNKSMPFDDGSLKKLYEAQINRNWKIRTKLKDVISAEAKQFLNILLEPTPEKRRTLDQLWLDVWVQMNSRIHLIQGSKPPLPAELPNQNQPENSPSMSKETLSNKSATSAGVPTAKNDGPTIEDLKIVHSAGSFEKMAQVASIEIQTIQPIGPMPMPQQENKIEESEHPKNWQRRVSITVPSTHTIMVAKSGEQEGSRPIRGVSIVVPDVDMDGIDSTEDPAKAKRTRTDMLEQRSRREILALQSDPEISEREATNTAEKVNSGRAQSIPSKSGKGSVSASGGSKESSEL